MQDMMNNVYLSLKESTKEIAGKRAEYEELIEKANSGNYSKEYLETEIYPKRDSMKKEIADDIASALEKAASYASTFKEEAKRKDALNPADITDDVKILNAGIKLKPRDIESILERNKDNETMTQITLRYAEENNIDLGSKYNTVYIGHAQEIEFSDRVISTIKIYSRWIDKPNAEEMLDKFFNVG